MKNKIITSSLALVICALIYATANSSPVADNNESVRIGAEKVHACEQESCMEDLLTQAKKNADFLLLYRSNGAWITEAEPARQLQIINATKITRLTYWEDGITINDIPQSQKYLLVVIN